MIVPRLFFVPQSTKPSLLINEVEHYLRLGGKALHVDLGAISSENATSVAMDIKKSCLHHNATLILDDLNIATLVNAHGVTLAIDDVHHGRAKDLLGADSIVGGRADNIEHVAELYEEGMADYLFLGPVESSDQDQRVLGIRGVQTILDDTRILGYHIPMLVAGGVNRANAANLVDMKPYGLVFSDLADFTYLNELIAQNPLRK